MDAAARLLIVDDSLQKRLAGELVGRGRPAETLGTFGLKRLEDPDVLKGLALVDMPWVFITGDDKMPLEHAALIAETRATIATVDGDWEAACSRRGVTMTEETFRRETIHRWAHVIVTQEPGAVVRYSPWGKDTWRPKRKQVNRTRRDATETRETTFDRRADSNSDSVEQGSLLELKARLGYEAED